jgi:hypothetical protein
MKTKTIFNTINNQPDYQKVSINDKERAYNLTAKVSEGTTLSNRPCLDL